MPQYKSVTVESVYFLTRDTDNETEIQGRDGWRVFEITELSDTKARIEFVKDD